MKHLDINTELSHFIYFNDQVIRCHGHSDKSIIKKVKSYYEGKYNFNCWVRNVQGDLIYKTV